MFVSKNEDRYLWFNGHSFDSPYNFELSGICLGLSIYNAVLLDIQFPHLVYKKLLNEPTSIEDIKEIHPYIYKGFKEILAYDGDVKNTFCLTFEIEYEAFYQKFKYNLKEKGSEIPVTKENAQEYVDLYVEWIINKSIEN